MHQMEEAVNLLWSMYISHSSVDLALCPAMIQDHMKKEIVINEDF